MSKFFLAVLNMSISASWLVLAVLLLRLVLKKAPKWITILLWGFVAFRLICPFSFESVLSLIPSAETISPEIMIDRTPEIHTGISSLNSVINPVISEAFTPALMDSANPLQIWIPVAALVWSIGIAAMLIYTAISYILLRRKVATAVLLQKNIYQSENVTSPFVLGIIKPKIYLPFQMDAKNSEYVIAHEVSHIRRKDHWWKPLGFALLTLHWFNPVLWLGYVLLCKDIELACDEKVIKDMDNEKRADYTLAIVACSVSRRSIAACPLAFGEVGVKERIKSVMHYRKPTFWILIAAMIICTIVGICFLTNPVSNILNNIEQYDLAAVTQDKTTVFVSDGETHTYIGGVDKEELNELYNIQISQDEVSPNRSHDRDKSHTLILKLHPEDPEDMLLSYIKGTYIHFNADFTQVWVDDGEKPTLSYMVLKPEKARFTYQSFENRIPSQDIENFDPVETINGNLKTYYKNADGTFRCAGITYQHRLEITGRMPNAAVDSTFVYLSNLKTITFSQAWKAAGLSSNLSDYFSAEEAVLVEWTSGELNLGSNEDNNKAPISNLDTAISAAIRNHHKSAKPDGLLNTESHVILVDEVVSGTPALGQTEHIQEETVFVYYLNLRFCVQDGRLEEQEGIYGQAIMTFNVDENGEYILKHYMQPEYSTDSPTIYNEELVRKFVSASKDVANNEEKYAEQLLDSCWKKATEYLQNLKEQAFPQPGETVDTPLIDGVSYDIDSDGKQEMCTLTYGPTSGLFSFCFYASPMEATASSPEYSETYVLRKAYKLSFDFTDDMKLRIKGDTHDSKEAVYFDIEVKNGHIVLHGEEEVFPFHN